MTDPLDILGLFAHPDDAELLVGGTLALAARLGRRTGVVALTRGETATRGAPETRAAEAAKAAKILGLSVMEILDLGDGDLANTQERRIAAVAAIRRLRPRLVLINALDERHPDHRRAHELARDAVYLANVGGFAPETGPRWMAEGVAWPAFTVRQPDPRADWVVDISRDWPVKLAAIQAYASQLAVATPAPDTLTSSEIRNQKSEISSSSSFSSDSETRNPKSEIFSSSSSEIRNPKSEISSDSALRTPHSALLPPTYIATPDFLDQVERRARSWGHLIGATHAEPFLMDRPPHAAHPLVTLTRGKDE